MTYAALIFVVADDLLVIAFPKYEGAESAVRILCAVAIFRSVGYVMPPLLDGVGHPERTFRYMATAAIALPLGYIGFAYVLGAQLGYLSVAVAWAVCYPIAFAVLVWMALDLLDLAPMTYLRAVAGILGCVAAAGLLGAGLHWALAGRPRRDPAGGDHRHRGRHDRPAPGLHPGPQPQQRPQGDEGRGPGPAGRSAELLIRTAGAAAWPRAGAARRAAGAGGGGRARPRSPGRGRRPASSRR